MVSWRHARRQEREGQEWSGRSKSRAGAVRANLVNNIMQMFSEHRMGARHCYRCWGIQGTQADKLPILREGP